MWLRSAIVATCAGLSLSHCTASPPEEPTPELALSMTQPLPFAGSPKVLLRVDNLGDEALHITRAGLDWSAYGGRTLVEKDVDLQPGERIDLTYRLPDEDCAPTEGRPEVVVVTDTADVAGPLRVYGEEFIRDLWATRCFAARLRAAADISYARDWTTEPSRVSADLVVRRREGDEPIRVHRARGSVLYVVRLPRAVTVPPGQDRARIPVEVLPNNRCDEHAIGQATAPYSFAYDITVGDSRRLVVRTPPVALQDDIARMLLDHCRRAGGIRINR